MLRKGTPYLQNQIYSQALIFNVALPLLLNRHIFEREKIDDKITTYLSDNLIANVYFLLLQVSCSYRSLSSSYNV